MFSLPFSFRNVLSFCVFLLLSLVISAQAEIPVNITYLDSAGQGFFDNTPRSPVPGNDGTTLGEQRRNAFEAAVYHWSKLLNGTIPLRVQATWSSRGLENLASASPLGYASDWSGVPVPGRYYPIALANQLAGLDHDPATDDIRVFCNEDWDNGVNAANGDSRKWFYGTNGQSTGGNFDFYSTMLHELGHGFGFLSFLNADGSWVNNLPTIYDHFMVNGAGTFVTGMTQSQRAAVTTSGNLFNASAKATSANYDQWAKLNAPPTYSPGSSISHLDELTFSHAESIDECMTPAASFSTHNIGPVAIGLFRDLGFNFVDNQTPTVAISLPANGSSRANLTIASGTALDRSSTGDAGATGLREVRVTLARQAGGNWYDWNADTWGSTTFNPSVHIKKADASIIPISKGTRTWAIALPTLPEGSYELQAQSVDQMNLGSEWVRSTFTIDRSAPSVSFDPLKNNDVVFNFSKIGGFAPGASAVDYAIYDVTDSVRHWNGSAWVNSGNAMLPSSLSAGRWAPADPAQLPTRAQIRLGTYQLLARATDGAGNQTNATILVTRSAADNTLPELTIVTPQANQVFTNRNLNAFSGLAADPESGIENVSAYLLRFAGSDIVYWDGTTWTPTPTTLELSIDKVGGTWQSSGALPTGAALPNGTYQVQVSVANGENPGGVRGGSVNFIVDYHPVSIWTAGSFSDAVAGNENYHFNNPANWNPFGVPSADGIVVVQGGQCDATMMGNLVIYGLNLANGGSLIAPNLYVKKLNMSSGGLEANNLTLNGDGGVFNWTGGRVKGQIEIPHGAVANLSGGGDKTLGDGTILNNRGTINWQDNGYIYNFGYELSQRCTINNHDGAVFNLMGDGTIFLSSYNRSTFNNFSGGKFVKTGGSGTLAADGFDFNNFGEIRAESGTIAFDAKLKTTDNSSFTGSGNITIRSGTCEFLGNVRLDGVTFEQRSGNVTGSAGLVLTMVNGASYNWTGGSLGGEIEIAQGGVVNVTGLFSKTIQGSTQIQNRGTFNWSGTGEIYTFAYNLADRATFHNRSGGKMNISDSAQFSYSYNPSTFINDAGGVVHKSDGGSSTFTWVFHNSGTVRCDTGSLAFSGGGNQSDTFIANEGAFIKFSGGTHQVADGTKWSGTGTYQVTSASVVLNGILEMGSDVTATGLEVSSGGTLEGQGEVAGKAAIAWTGGALGGTLHLGPGVTFTVSGNSSKTFRDGAVINNGGAFTWDGTGELYASAYALSNRVTFNNLSNAVFNIASNANFSASYNASIFNNHEGATVLKSAGGGLTRFDWNFNNFGMVQSRSGTISFNAAGNSGGAFIAETNGIIRFGGGRHTLTNDTILNGGGKIQIATEVIHAGDIHIGTSDVPATWEISTGAFEGSGALKGFATINWSGGRIGGGRLDVPPSVSFHLSGGSEKTFGVGTIFNNEGVFTVDGTGPMYCSAYQTNGAVFNNLAGGIFKVANDGTIFLTSYNPSHFTNHAGALIVKEGTSGTTTLNSFTFSNAGEVRVQTGIISFSSPLSLNSGSLFTGTGSVRLTDTITLTGTLLSTVPVSLNGGQLIGLDAALAGTGGYTWSNGTIAGTLSINSDASLTMQSASDKMLANGTVIQNFGTVTFAGSGTLYASGHQSSGGPAFIYNKSGAVWNWNTDAGASYSYLPSVFINESGAVFRRATTSGVATMSWDFRNAGTIDLTLGSLALNGGISNAPTALTRLALGGTVANSDYSQLTTTGQLPISGRLEVMLRDGYVPTNGSIFSLLGYESRTGTFAPITLPSLGDDLKWDLRYEAKALVARAVPITRIQLASTLVDGHVQFTTSGEPASQAVVEISHDLVTWQAVSTNTPFTGTLIFTDPVVATESNKFYRVMLIK